MVAVTDLVHKHTCSHEMIPLYFSLYDNVEI